MLRAVLTRRVLAAAARAARKRPTPFFLFDANELGRQARAWRRTAESLGPADLYYPYKCNRATPVLERLAREGFGAEVTALTDLRQAVDLGIPGERLILQGPAKSPALIDAGLAAGALFVADGPEDTFAILARAHGLGALPRYLLRLAPRAALAPQRTFGLPARELVGVAREISRRAAPPHEGLAFHLGTGISAAAPYLRAIGEAADAARAIGALGLPTFRLDLGGGFAAQSESRRDGRGHPLPPGTGPDDLLPRLAARARRLMGSRIHLLFEPGRALVSGSVHLLARVIRVRRRSSHDTAYLDASRLSHAYFVALGSHPIAVIPRRPGPAREAALAGPLGVGLDRFTLPERLAPLAAGDLVVIGSVGAYNQNAANAWSGTRAPLVAIPTGSFGAKTTPS